MIKLSLAKLMKFWVLSLSTLYFIAPTSVGIGTKFIGIVFTMLIFSPLFLTKNEAIEYAPEFPRWKISAILSVLIIQFACMNYAAEFYAGVSIKDIITNITSSTNSYAQYQNHFKENEIASFTLNKIPALLSLATVKFIFLYFTAALLFKKAGIVEKFLYASSIIPILLMAGARGTFFEVFEIFALLIYGACLKIKKIRIKNIIYTGIVSVVLVFGFLANTMRRYEDPSSYFKSICATSMYCFEKYGISFYIEYFLYVLSTYFSMGMFFLSSYIELLFNGDYTASLLPLYSISIFEFYKGGLEISLCTTKFDCRAVWMPELISWISFFGGITVFFAIGKLLISLPKLEKYIYTNGGVFSFPIAGMLFIYTISLPVGKFWTVSSQNILCTFAFLCLFFISKKSRKQRTKVFIVNN